MVVVVGLWSGTLGVSIDLLVFAGDDQATAIIFCVFSEEAESKAREKQSWERKFDDIDND